MVANHGVREVSKDEAKEEAEKGGNLFSRFIKMIADIFVPILPALVAGGLMMAINNVMTAEGLFGEQSLTTMYPAIADYAALINMVSSAAFASLPVLVGFSAAKRLRWQRLPRCRDRCGYGVVRPPQRLEYGRGSRR